MDLGSDGNILYLDCENGHMSVGLNTYIQGFLSHVNYTTVK